MNVERRPSRSPVVIRPVFGSAEYEAVLQLAKTAKATVGFLKNAAFAQRARKGSILAAEVDGEIVAYLLYDLPRDEVRIVQLVVGREHRGQGLARVLVDALASEQSHRRGIFLSCRNDFEADKLWPQLDFIPLRERPGRSIEGKLLTRWFRSFGQPDLFTILHEEDTRPLAVMDSSVFFDVVAKRPKDYAQQLKADWLVEHVRFAVADHLLVEIHRNADPAERQRQTAATEPLRLASGATKGWRSHFDALKRAHPKAPDNDLNDLKHVAEAIAANAGWVITTDRRFVSRYSATAWTQGSVRILLASAFLREIDEMAQSDRYRPVDLAGTSVARRQADASSLADLSQEFVHHAAGERIRDLRATIERAAGDPQRCHLELIEVDGARRGLVCWERAGDAIDVLAIRTTAGPAEQTIGRHLLAMVRDQAVSAGTSTIRVRDETPSLGVEGSFRDEGYARAPAHDGAVVAHVLPGRGSLQDLQALAEKHGSPLADSRLFEPNGDDLVDRAASAERWFAPFMVTGAGIPTFFVPIKHGWATDLVDVGLAEAQLLARPWQLGLRRELVYYRSPLNSGQLGAPARLVWYVSGKAPGAGNIRAVSHLTDVVVDAHERLFHRFKALGVCSADDVKKVAGKKGVAMAMRFTATRRLKPVPLDRYRELVTGDPKSKDVVLRSIRPLSEHVFVSLLELGADHAS